MAIAYAASGANVSFGIAGQNPAAQNISVPADATAIVFTWSTWNASGGLNLSSLTLNGVSLTVLENVAASGDYNANGVAWRAITGSEQGQTLALDWAWSGTPSEGPTVTVVFIKGTNLTVRDSASTAWLDSGSPSTTVNTNTTDFVLFFASSYFSLAAPNGTGTNQVVDYNNVAEFNSYSTDVCRRTSPGASSSTVTATLQYGALVAVSFYEGASALEGVGTGSLELTGSAAGAVVLAGAGAASLELVATASFTSTGESSLELSGTAAGAVGLAGAGTGSLELSGTAAGAVALEGSGAGNLALSGAASALLATDMLLSVHASGRYVVNASDEPVYLVTETVWSWMASRTLEDWQTLIADCQARGVNALIVSFIEHKFTDNSPAWRNEYGELPFTGTAFQSALNSAYVSRAQSFVAACQAAGIYVLMWPAYVGFAGGDEGWNSDLGSASEAQLEAYGAAVGAAFEHFDNILYVMFGDHDPADHDPTNAVVAGIQSADTRHTLYSGHYHPNDSSWTNHESYFTFGFSYPSGYDYMHVDVRQGWQSSPTVPLLLGEARYIHNPSLGVAEDYRRQLWGAFVGGALMGAAAGSEDLWPGGEIGDTSTGIFQTGQGWEASLDDPERDSLNPFAAFIAAHRWWLLLPDFSSGTPALGSLNTFVLNRGSETVHDYMTGAVASDGSWAVAYIPSGNAEIEIDRTELSGAFVARWYDPRDGTYQLIGTRPNTGTEEFAVPDDDDDWVLVLELASDGAGAAALELAGSAAGAVDAAGAATDTLQLSAAAAGAVDVRGVGSGALELSAGSSGAVAAEGAAASILAIDGAATGATGLLGAAEASLAVDASASGVIDAAGAGAAALGLDAEASGAVAVDGAGTAQLELVAEATPPSVTSAGEAALELAGSATGAVEAAGAGAGDLALEGAGAGTVGLEAAAAASLTIDPVASGALEVLASGGGSLELAGSAAGAVALEGAGSVALEIVAAAELAGLAAGALEVVGVAAGAVGLEANGSGLLEELGAAGGAVAIEGSGVATLELAGSAAGSALLTAAGAGDLALAGAGAGAVAIEGAGSAQLEIEGAAASSAAASGSLLLTGAAAGAVAVDGTGAGSLQLAASAVGQVHVPGTGAGALQLSASAIGDLTLASTGTSSLNLTGVAAGAADLITTGAAALPLTAAASGAVAAKGAGTGALELDGEATIAVATTADLELDAEASGAVAVDGAGSSSLGLSAGASGAVDAGATGSTTLELGAEAAAGEQQIATGIFLGMVGVATGSVAARGAGEAALQLVALADTPERASSRRVYTANGQIPVGKYYVTQGDERIDQVAQFVYGIQGGAVEPMLLLNPGLAELGSQRVDFVLPRGVAILLPQIEAEPAKTFSREQRLWGVE